MPHLLYCVFVIHIYNLKKTGISFHISLYRCWYYYINDFNACDRNEVNQ